MLQPTSIIRFVALLFVILQISLFAQPQNLKFQRLDVKDGLSNRDVNCIFQDSRGFLWFGTATGLNRYDGYEFKQYYAFPGDRKSLSNSFITAIAEDSSGFLWVGTSNGLNRLDPFTGNVLRLKNDDVKLTNQKITEILVDKENNVWVGTVEGLNKLQRQNHSDHFRVRHFNHEAKKNGSIINNHIHAIYENKSGNIYIGTNLWMTIYNTSENRMESVELVRIYPNGFEERIESTNTFEVYDFLEMPDGKVWFAMGTTYFAYILPGEKKAYCYTLDITKFGIYRNLVKENRTAFWFSNSSNNHGLAFFDTQTKYARYFNVASSENSQLQTNVIKDLIRDRAGVLWMSLEIEGGIYKHDPRKPIFHTIDLKADEKIEGQQTLGIMETNDGKIWIANWTKRPDVYSY